MTSGRLEEGEALVALGSNLPWRGLKPSEILDGAVAKLGEFGAVTVRSGWWRTAAWPDPTDPPFLNLCVRMRTTLEPAALLAGLLAVERAFGRERGAANAPRTLDLDLIDAGGQAVNLPAEGDRPRLTLPHPRVHERAFVLLPLADIAPEWRHPVLGVSVHELIARLTPEQRGSARRVSPEDRPE